MKKFLAITFFLFLIKGREIYAQQINDKIKKGNDFYKQQQYDKAIAAYNEALKTDPANTTAKFNAANTLTIQQKYNEAIKLFEDVVMDSNDPELKGKAYYNKGVVLSNQQKLEESIEAYKNALRQNPNDNEARENLQKALLELKKKTPPPPKEDKKKKQQQQQKKQQQRPKMNQKEAEQRLKLLEQKEKEVLQRFEKSNSGGSQKKDW